MNFNGECSEVEMYLALSRVAFREGYPELGMYYDKAAFEEAEHASKFAELLGEVVTTSTKKILKYVLWLKMKQLQAKQCLQREQKNSDLMQSMTLFTKLLVMKQGMVEHLQDFLFVTLKAKPLS